MMVTTKTERTYKWYLRLKKSEIRTLIFDYHRDLGIECDNLKYTHWDRSSLASEAYRLYVKYLEQSK